jgi:transcriptional regulator with XRE-family HTH domain
MNKSGLPIRAALARNLRRIRASHGLSQEALADLAGLHRTFVGSVEREERNISIDNVARLAGALGVTAADLLSERADG